MGIAGLLKNLHPLLVAPPTHPSNQQQNNNGGSRNNTKVQHNIRQFSGKSIAIDASGWLHKAAYTCAERLVESTENGTRDSVAEQKYTKYMIDRCSELLQFAQIDKIYLVFDGLRVPLKSGTNASRESKRQANLKEARRLMACGRRSEAHEKYRMCAKGSEIMARVVAAKVQERWGKDDTGTNDTVRVKCVWSPYEADSQLAKLCVDGWCHAVVTEDSDVLVYSAVTRKPFPIIYKLDRKDGSCDVVSMDWLLNPAFLASLNGSNKSKKKKKSRRRRRRDLEQDLDYIYNNSSQDDDENEDNEGDDDISDPKAQDDDEPQEIHPCEVEYDDQGMAPVRRALPPPSASNNNNSKKKKSSGNDGNAKMLAYLRSFANKEVAKPGEGVRLFVQACVLSGCDYIVNRLSKVGPVTAFRLVKEASHRDAGIRFERVLKSLPSGSKLVAEASDKSSEDGDNEDAEYDDFLELPDTDRDSKEKYEELLSKSEAVFYYHLTKEISSNKVLPLVGHKSSSAIDVDDEEEEEELDIDESFRPCLERFEVGLTFVGSAEEALKKKHGPLPPANGRHYRQAVSNNNGWLQTKKKGSGPIQNNYQKPSTNFFQKKSNSATTTAAAPKQKVTATIATQPTGLNKYFSKPQQQKSTTTSSKKSSHFQKPAASANATATELKPNPYAAFSHGIAAEEKTTSTKKKKKKKSTMPTLSDRATNKAMMKSPPNFSPVRFDYGGYTPQGNSQKKSIKAKSCVDINKSSATADDNDTQRETFKESDNRKDEQMKVPIAASNTTNDHAFDYGIQVPESPPVKERLEPGTGSLSRYIDETKSFDKPRRVSTSPEKIKQNQSNNSEDVIELLDEDDDDLSTSAVNSDENQPNYSQTSKTAPIIKSSVNNRQFKSPYPTTTSTGQSSTKQTTKKKATSSSALLAGFSRQRKAAAAGSTRGGIKRSRFFPTSRTTDSSQQKKSVKRPKGVPSLKNFMVNKE